MKKTELVSTPVLRKSRFESRSSRSLVLGAAVLAAMTALAPSTFAQNRIGGDGRLLDASNRVGSGGFNDNSSAALPPGTLNNLLVTGNVTGGVGFQGSIPYFAPGAFHGNLAGSTVDNFVASSTNVQTNGTIVNNAQNVHLFVGDSTAINAPAGFVSTGAQPGYIPAQQVGGSQFTSDTRLGVQSSAPVSSYVSSAIFQTGGTAGGGGTSAYTSASPLLGVKTLQNVQQVSGTGQFTDTSSEGAPLNSAIGSGDRVDLSADLKPASLSDNSALNSSLSSAGISGLPPGVASFATPNANGASAPAQYGAVPGQNVGTAGNASASGNSSSGSANGTGAAGANGQTANGSAGGQNGPIDASVGGQVTGGQLSGAGSSGSPLNATIGGSAFSGSVTTGEDNSINVYSPTSNQPGSAYSRMLMRFKTINPNAPLTLQQRNLLNQAKIQDVKIAAAANKPGEARTGSPAGVRAGGASESPALGAGQPGLGQTGVGQTGLGQSGLGQTGLGQTSAMNASGLNSGGLGGSGSHAGPVVPGQVSPVEKGKPVLLDSFSKDETSPGAKEHLAKAEDFMKQGKFTSALEEYDLVEQLSPSDPYTQLGRANAELGASYYGLAEAHLRQAFTTDEALLSAQLDLKTFLGEDKLQYLVKDLKEIAQNNPTDERPVFLLAYICYNTNNPRGAAAYLDLAQKREGKPDPFFALLRAHWDLPDVSDSGGELNK